MDVAIIGSLPPPIGGTSISLQGLINSLSKGTKIKLNIFDTSLLKKASFISVGLIFLTLLKVIIKSEVISIHFAIKQYSGFGLFIILIARLLGKKIILRRFGGLNIDDMPSFISRKAILLSYRLSNIILCQTKSQLNEAQRYSPSSKSIWFPTSREKPSNAYRKFRTGYKNKLIFISQIKFDKGIFELINAFLHFCEKNSDVTLDVYGPLFDDIKIETIQLNERIKYKGILKSENVYDVLSNSDCLIFPSYYSGEGYSGILIEALLTNTPIIATDWKFNKELLGDAAIFVPIKNEMELQNAIVEIYTNTEKFFELSQRANIRSGHFDQEMQTNVFLSTIRLWDEKNEHK